MSGISDPGRAGRGDRKRAQKLIDAAYAAGRLTAADRVFRTERVDSAHTKGDLAILVRDLERAAAAGATVQPQAPPPPPTDPTSGRDTRSLGSAIPPDQLNAMKGGSAAAIRVADSMRSALTGEGVRRARRIFLIVLVGFILLCGLGISGLVTWVVTGVNDAVDGGGNTPASTVNLHTAKGWSEMVAAVEDETGSGQVYDIVVYPEYASVNTVAEEGAQRYVYRDGSFDLLSSPVTPASGDPIDLADVDPELIEGLPDETAEHQDMPDYDSAYIIVNTMNGEPAIMVYLQESGRLSRWSIYDLDGTVIGGTPG